VSPDERPRGRTMSAPRYGPDASWPSHEKKHWHEPLAAARRAGWTLIYVNAPHRFGVVYCPANEHSFMVDKTAKGSETKAKEALKKIAWCDHPAGHAQTQRDESQRLLDTADRLSDEVEEGLIMAEAKRDAQEVLDRLEIQLDTAASNVDDVLLTEQETALEAAIEVDDAPDPPVLAGKLDEATTAVAGSESIAKSVRAGRPGVAKPLQDRARTLRARIDELGSRLAGLQERKRSSLG
jgi:hypothetical protein